LSHDLDWRVRYEVASRIPLSKVAELADDDDLLVREMVLARLVCEQEPQRGMLV
jgi:hypothetical protein